MRGLGILSKFLLTLLLTKKISLQFQGEYALISTSIAIMVLVLGLDFYIYSNKLVIREKEKSIFFLKNNLLFYLLVYTALIPLFYFVFGNIFHESGLSLGLLIILVVLEHLGQEFFRLYVALERIFLANVVLFLRTGLWSSLLVIYLLIADPPSIEINDILAMWIFSSTLAVVIAIARFPSIHTFFAESIDWKWIKEGLKVAFYMFLGTILLKGIEYLDRYLIDYFYTKEEVGIYTFYFQLANLSNVIIFTLYLSFLYPRLIHSIHVQDYVLTRKLRVQIKRKSIELTLLLGIGFLILLPPLLDFIDRPRLYEYTEVLYILLASNLMLNMSYAGHYSMIARNKEKEILIITSICFLISFTINLLLIPLIGIWGAVTAQIVANSLFFLLKDRGKMILLSKDR